MSDTISTNNSGRNELVSMVNEDRLLRVVKRLFTGSVKEVLGELLQNSQRAGAKAVNFTISDGAITMADDGTGLIGTGADKFVSSMRIAESSYERAEVTEQDPMGVGLFSLFALEGVREVVLSSGGFSLVVDTERFWNEDGNWQSWRNRVSENHSAQPSETAQNSGLEIVVKANDELLKIVEKTLTAVEDQTSIYYTNDDYKSPVRGYAGIMEVFLNGTLLENTCERVVKMDATLIETTYQGNRVIIGVDGFAHRNTVNWYGQLIDGGNSHLRYYLEVRTGRPVNPLSPSRRGIIDDTDFKSFRQFLREQLRTYILNTPKEALTALVINTAYSSDKAWADEFCPYFTATKIDHDEGSGNSENWLGNLATRQILSYDENPLLIADTVAVVNSAENQARSILEIGEPAKAYSFLEYGAKSFAPVIEQVLGETAYEINSGNPHRLNVKQIWWKPGVALEEFLVESGEFALSDTKLEVIPESGWEAIGSHTVFAYECTENWDITQTDGLIVGVRDDLQQKLGFLNVAAWCVWDYNHDNADSDTLEDSFRKSLEEMKASLFTDCLPDETFDFYQIGCYFPTEKGEQLTALEMIYADEQRIKPQSIRAVMSSGRRVEKLFLSAAETSLNSAAVA